LSNGGDLPELDLDVDRGFDFLAWEKQWNSFMTFSGLTESDATIKILDLQFCMPHYSLTDAQRADQAQIVAHVQGWINETVKRQNFRQHKQAPGELSSLPQGTGQNMQFLQQ